MSTAHRPTFTAAKGRESKAHLSAQTTMLDMPTHTKLKFRAPPASSTTSTPSASGSQAGAGARRDLKRELEEAEWEATNRKRIKAGLEPLPRSNVPSSRGGEEDTVRREAIARAIELDRDSSSSSSAASSASNSDSESDADEVKAETEEGEETAPNPSASDSESGSDSDSDSDSESEDEQAALLRELEKIKAERAAEKARLASLSSSAAQLSRDEEIARGNPLLNLQAALHPSSSAASSFRESESQSGSGSGSGSGRGGGGVDFGVRRRWDDDVIFKNQASAAGHTGKSTGTGSGGGFVNDLTRSEFHKKFMNRYIK